MQSNWYKPHYKNVPQSWVICKLADVCYVESGYAFSSDDYSRSGTPLVRISNIIDSQISLESCVYINSECDKRFHVKKGDLLIAMSGATTGKMGVYDSNETAFLNQRVGNIKVINENVLLNDYRNIFMYSQIGNILELAYGGAQPNISANIICSLPIPIPSIKEQKRIIMAVGKWFSLIDTLETAKEDLQTSIEYTKSKILDLAIHGKLVPQDPNDEPAIELLSRINPRFTPCDNAHYENMPTNWALARVEDIGQLLSGRDLTNDECNSDNMGLPYLIGASNIEGDTFSFIRWTEKPQVISQMGDILISCKGTIGTIVKNDIGDMHIARQFMAIRPNTNCITSDYLHICLITAIEEIKKDARGVIPGISRDDILTKVFTIPPLNEQRRIVAEMNLYYRVFDNISANL